MLSVEELHVHYGGIHAIKGISLDVPQGKIVTLIGANGAGKSSTLRAVAGLVRQKKGRILYKEEDILHRSPEHIVRAGIAMVPEGGASFRSSAWRRD
jgi:branched-chain amino acid transport system ATP-binding protein